MSEEKKLSANEYIKISSNYLRYTTQLITYRNCRT